MLTLDLTLIVAPNANPKQNLIKIWPKLMRTFDQILIGVANANHGLNANSRN